MYPNNSNAMATGPANFRYVNAGRPNLDQQTEKILADFIDELDFHATVILLFRKRKNCVQASEMYRMSQNTLRHKSMQLTPALSRLPPTGLQHIFNEIYDACAQRWEHQFQPIPYLRKNELVEKITASTYGEMSRQTFLKVRGLCQPTNAVGTYQNTNCNSNAMTTPAVDSAQTTNYALSSQSVSSAHPMVNPMSQLSQMCQPVQQQNYADTNAMPVYHQQQIPAQMQTHASTTHIPMQVPMQASVHTTANERLRQMLAQSPRNPVVSNQNMLPVQNSTVSNSSVMSYNALNANPCGQNYPQNHVGVLPSQQPAYVSGAQMGSMNSIQWNNVPPTTSQQTVVARTDPMKTVQMQSTSTTTVIATQVTQMNNLSAPNVALNVDGSVAIGPITNSAARNNSKYIDLTDNTPPTTPDDLPVLDSTYLSDVLNSMPAAKKAKLSEPPKTVNKMPIIISVGTVGGAQNPIVVQKIVENKRTNNEVTTNTHAEARKEIAPVAHAAKIDASMSSNMTQFKEEDEVVLVETWTTCIPKIEKVEIEDESESTATTKQAIPNADNTEPLPDRRDNVNNETEMYEDISSDCDGLYIDA